MGWRPASGGVFVVQFVVSGSYIPQKNVHNFGKMVATRHSLPSASLEASPPPEGDEKAQKELRKLQIDGKDTLKGDAPAQKAEIQTYHWRGAVYEVTDATAGEWVEQQPKRWKKRESIAAFDGANDYDDEEDEENIASDSSVKEKPSDDESDEERDAPPASRTRRNVPKHYYGRPKRTFTSNNAPNKRKRSPEPADMPLNPSKAFDYAVIGRPQSISCSEAARNHAISRGYEYKPITRDYLRNSQTLGRRVLRDVRSLAQLNEQLERLEEQKYANTAVLDRLYKLRDLAKNARQPAPSPDIEPVAAPTEPSSSYNPPPIVEDESPATKMRAYLADQEEREQEDEEDAAARRHEQREAERREVQKRAEEFGCEGPPEWPTESTTYTRVTDFTRETDISLPTHRDDASSVEFVTERYDSGAEISPAHPTDGKTKSAPRLGSPWKPEPRVYPDGDYLWPLPPADSVPTNSISERSSSAFAHSGLFVTPNKHPLPKRPPPPANPNDHPYKPLGPTAHFTQNRYKRRKLTSNRIENSIEPRQPTAYYSSEDPYERRVMDANRVDISNEPRQLSTYTETQFRPLQPTINLHAHPYTRHQPNFDRVENSIEPRQPPSNLPGDSYMRHQPIGDRVENSIEPRQPTPDLAESAIGPRQPPVSRTTTAKDGSTIRWCLPDNIQDVDRAEHAVYKGRLPGESRSAARRRVRREKQLLTKWEKDGTLMENLDEFFEESLEKAHEIVQEVGNKLLQTAVTGNANTRPAATEEDRYRTPTANTTNSLGSIDLRSIDQASGT